MGSRMLWEKPDGSWSSFTLYDLDCARDLYTDPFGLAHIAITRHTDFDVLACVPVFSIVPSIPLPGFCIRRHSKQSQIHLRNDDLLNNLHTFNYTKRLFALRVYFVCIYLLKKIRAYLILPAP